METASITPAPAPAPAPVDRSTDRLRRGLIALAAASTLGTVFELVTSRHWGDPVQLFAWGGVAGLGVATGLALVQGRRALVAVRALSAAIIAISVFGIYEHIRANMGHVGSSEGHVAMHWDGFSLIEKLWYAATKTVGHSPPLAPGILALGALMVVLSTVGRR